MDESTLLGRSQAPVTRSRVAHDLAALGLRDGDVVMFHTRMSAIGYVAGGPQTIIGALHDVVGARGTLMVTCGWNDAPPYDLTNWPQAWQDAVRAEHPAYDPDLSEADHNNGRLPEALRRWPGAVRSRHPDASFAALGADAAELMADHPWDDPHGPGSPLARLVAHDGRVLLLGAPLDTMTLLHHAEALAEAPGKRFVDYAQPILADGERVWRRFHDIDSENGAFDYSAVVPSGQDPFDAIARDMLATGIGRTGRVGAAESYLFDARPAVDFATAWIEDRLGGAADVATRVIGSVALRPIVEADLGLLARFSLEPGLIGPNWYGFRDAGRLRRRFETDGFLGAEDGQLIVTVDDEPAGFVGWRPAGHGAGRYHTIGIVLLPEWRGKRVGTQAQRLLCEYLFTHTAAQRIEAGTQPENVAEQRALETVGFRREGTLRAAEFRDGQWRDIVVYGLVRGEQHAR